MLEAVELHNAYFWDCPSCGQENFGRLIRPEFSEDELAEMREDWGVQPWESGEFLLRPKSVECSRCGEGFVVEDEG